MKNQSWNKYPPNKQTEENTVRAPYNFVPFSDKEPFMRYADVDELPAHDRLRSDLYTGEIHLTLTAKTPVFVSDGGRENADFVKDADGRYLIPGSTVRGMARENMQILGNGLVLPGEDLDDRRIFYRQIAAQRGSMVKGLYTKYRNRLDVRKTNYKYPLPCNVESGYLKKCGSGENAPYRIYKTSRSAMFVSRKKVQEVFPFRSSNPRALEKPGVKAVCYTADGRYVTGIFAPESASARGKKQGVLLYTDRYISKDPNHLYVFPAFDEKQPSIAVSDADRIEYEMDCRACKKKGVYLLSNLKNGDTLPVFYTQLKDSKGKTHTYFGLTQYPRIGHTHSICDGLPQAQRDKQGVMPLDYPHAILGFTHTEKAQRKNKMTAYRSRVSFGDFAAQEDKKPEDWGKTILGEPKPSFYGGYLAADKDNKAKHYSDDEFRLRGFKQYWLKEAKLPKEQGKEKMENRIKPLPAGTAFTGTVRFKNLHKDELGLLLWSLVLNDGCFQSIGMAKPYGLGRVSVKVDSLRLFDWKTLYSAAGLNGTAENKAYKPFIEAYKQYIGEKQPDIEARPEIQDFFYMKQTVCKDTDKVAYLALNGELSFRKMSYPMPTVAEKRKEAQKEAERKGRK